MLFNVYFCLYMTNSFGIQIEHNVEGDDEESDIS